MHSVDPVSPRAEGEPPKRSWLAALAASSAFAVPLAMSMSSSPAPIHPVVMGWYLSLRKPWFKPPDVLIPLAWTGVEAGLAVAAYRLLRAAPSATRSGALALLACNTVAIGGWSRLFFGRRNIGGSVVAAGAMVASGAVFVQQAGKIDRVSARAGVPFVAWVGFATLLTAAIWQLNRAQR